MGTSKLVNYYKCHCYHYGIGALTSLILLAGGIPSHMSLNDISKV